MGLSALLSLNTALNEALPWSLLYAALPALLFAYSPVAHHLTAPLELHTGEAHFFTFLTPHRKSQGV